MVERVWFPSTVGPRLAGLIDHPEGRMRGWGVFSHGFTLGKDSPAASRICKQLAREGVGMLRFDNLGLGDSEGDWGDGSFSHKVADTVQAVTVHERVRPRASGSWWGIHSAARRSSRRPTTWCPVRAVASIGAPSEPGTWNTTTTRWWNGSSPTGRRPFANASKIFRAARHPRSFVSLEGADHLLTGRKQAKGRPGSSARRPIPTWPTSWLRFRAMADHPTPSVRT